MIRPTPPASGGPQKRKPSTGAKHSKDPKAQETAGAAKKGKMTKGSVTPDDLDRVRGMFRDKALLDWLDQCAGQIRLGGGTITLVFGGKVSARSVLQNAAFSLRHLVFEEKSGSK